MAGLTIASLDWGNRNPNEFIDAAVKNTAVLDLFTLVDNVKSKYQFPIADGSLEFGTDQCVFDPLSSASIDEKEMTVTTRKWAFKNCKSTLQDSYRSLLLKQGANNAETMDRSFKEWIFDYFSKLAGQKVLEVAATELRAEIVADGDVTDKTSAALTKSNILAAMESMYVALPAAAINSLYGVADRQYKPAFFMNANSYRFFQLAQADKNTINYDGVRDGKIEKYLDMEVHVFSTLPDNEMILTTPDNLVMLVDDYSDVDAIQNKYIDEIGTDYLWGVFTIGFSYKKGEDIVHLTLTP